MSNAPFMPLWVSDFLGDTLDLDATEIGAYLLLLMAQWNRDGESLPDDPKKLQRVARCGRNWPAVWASLERFFSTDEDGVYSKRLRYEAQNVAAKREVNARNGALGGKAKALKSNKPDLANGSETPKRTAAIPEPEPDIEKEDKSSSSMAADYQKFLEAHPKPVESKAGEAAFNALVEQGESPAQIIAAAAAYAKSAKTFSTQSFVQQSDNFLDPERGKWRAHVPTAAKAPPSNDDVLRGIAHQINSDGYFSASSLSAHKARQLVAANLVTKERLQQRGIEI